MAEPVAEMAAFDALPPIVRAFAREVPLDYPADALRAQWPGWLAAFGDAETAAREWMASELATGDCGLGPLVLNG